MSNDLPALDVPLFPQHFHGRGAVLDPICHRLRQPELLSSQVVGGPKSGKTSLLSYLASSYADAQLGEAARCVRVYLDATVLAAKDSAAQFWMLACRELRRSTDGQALLAANPGLETLRQQALQRADDHTLDIFDLQDLFDGFAELKRPVVLLVDEFDVVIANPHFLPPAEFFNQVRNLCNRAPRGLSFVASTKRPLSDVATAAAGPSPPYNHFGTLHLGLLGDDDIRALVDREAQCRGITPAPQAWQPIAQASQGHPLLACYLARRAVEAMAAGTQFDDAALVAAMTDPDGPYAKLYRAIFGVLNARERQAVQAWQADPASVTDAQRVLLQRLRSFALLPPGVVL